MMIEKLHKLILETLKALDLPEVEFVVEHPADEAHGDYSTNISLVLSKQVGKNPRELASQIMDQLVQNKTDYVEKIEIAGPGFINFFLTHEYLLSEMGRVLSGGGEYGKNSSLKGKKIMVEFAHPNTHKEFHIGHLRNISIGESLVRILEAGGAEVIRANYQGDVGLHIAKAIWGILDKKEEFESLKNADILDRVKFLGQTYAHGSTAYKEDEEAKKTIIDYNKQIFLGKGEIISLWEETRQWSLDYFEKIYSRVGTHYDRYYFESECRDGVEVAKKALEKGILKESDGAVVFDGSPYGLDTRVFINSEGLPTYEAKELSLAPKQFTEHGNIDVNYHVVGPEQKSFFSVVIKVEELLDPEMFKGKQVHYVYEYVGLKSGKMSSRTGNIVTGWWVMEEAKNRIMKKLSENGRYSNEERNDIAEQVAIGAVKYAFLKVAPKMRITFDFDESLSFEGNSGPYVQYVHTRCKSVLEKANVEVSGSMKMDIQMNEEEISILKWLYRYSEIISRSVDEMTPHHLVHYLHELAGRFNTFYNKHSVLSADNEEEKSFRLSMTAAVAQVIENGLNILGIPVPEKM